eukprot:7652828-Alexandrium_andersonii.AAC.1
MAETNTCPTTVQGTRPQLTRPASIKTEAKINTTWIRHGHNTHSQEEQKDREGQRAPETGRKCEGERERMEGEDLSLIHI